ncbi:unnamed protein product [Callosobruchus maculatus]|uniref:Uncharacterized protein n=1 Tax=Callosobruchus maculatus TaxID=64391 RepID=A0A653CT53_CALMS|nr:unnamed protein product [Callosobruchus maculatus]
MDFMAVSTDPTEVQNTILHRISPQSYPQNMRKDHLVQVKQRSEKEMAFAHENRR